MPPLMRVGSLVLILALLGPWLAGCADRGESRDARLDRLEARLDRLDDRLTRTEALRDADELAGIERDEIESVLGGMDPERRERIRARVRGIRERIEKLREGADLTAEPDTPEFRRGLLLEMMQRRSRRGAFGQRDTNEDGDTEGPAEEKSGDDAPTG